MTKSRSLSIGFIGGSLYSAVGYAHSVSCTIDNRWTLEAGCFSTDKKKNFESAQVYGVSSDRVYRDWQHLLENEKGQLDAIAVLTPTPSHFDVVMACLEKDFPVICEKSLATNSANAKAIRDLCYKKNGFVAVTYNYSGYPMLRELRDLIRKGALGKVIHFQAEMPQEGYIRIDAQGNKPSPQSWRLSDGYVPIIYLDLASHLHHLIYYLIGENPLEVVADQSSYGWFPEVIDNVTCLCRYSGGVQGQMWFSKSALGHRNGLRLRIYGSKASAEWFQLCPEDLLLSYSDGRREIMDRASTVTLAALPRFNRFKAGHPAGFIEAFGNLYADIADCVRQYKTTGNWKSDNVFDADLALAGLRLFETMSKSVKTRSWEKVLD